VSETSESESARVTSIMVSSSPTLSPVFVDGFTPGAIGGSIAIVVLIVLLLIVLTKYGSEVRQGVCCLLNFTQAIFCVIILLLVILIIVLATGGKVNPNAVHLAYEASQQMMSQGRVI